MAQKEYKWSKLDNMPTSAEYFLVNRSSVPNKKASYSLNVFCYRYRLAKSFVGISAKEVGKTLLGYVAAMKISLAYSAYDELATAATELSIQDFKHKNYNIINNKAMAEKLIKNTKLMTLLRNKTIDKNLSDQIEMFLKGESFDILCIARAIRNVFIHGTFTTTSGGVKNRQDAEIYFELAETLLKYCDGTFTRCIKKLNLYPLKFL